MVADWLGGVDPEGGGFRLATHYPRRVFEAAELRCSLAELGLYPAAALFIEEEEEADEEDDDGED